MKLVHRDPACGSYDTEDWLRHVLGDGAVDVGDDNLVVPVPQIDGALAAARALVLGCDAKRHIVRSFLQFQAGLVTQGEQWRHREAQESSSTGLGSYNEATNLGQWFWVDDCDCVPPIGQTLEEGSLLFT